jgi:hypothetical protein
MTITWKEFGLHVLGVVIVVTVMYQMSIYSATADVEIWNGEVSSKKMERVSCRHSYDCFCVTVSCGKDCTTRSCQTCYDHNYDNDWTLRTSLGRINIRTIDRQGLKEPPRWSVAKKGDPVAEKHKFTNYIKAAPESIFNDLANATKGFDKLIPEYPSTIYDLHYIDRVIAKGVNIPIKNILNKDLANMLKPLGSSKQVNAIIVFAGTENRSYIHALEKKWLGGKKNDVVVVIGTKKYPEIAWVDIMSWTKSETFKVKLRDSLTEHGKIDREIVNIMGDNISKHFVRRQMADFEYLKNAIEPSTKALMIMFIIGVLVSSGLAYYFHRNDVFEDEHRIRRRR